MESSGINNKDDELHEFSLFQTETKIVQSWNKIRDAAVKIFTTFENVLWRYISNTNNLAKRVLKILTFVSTELKDKLTFIIPKLGLISLISCLLTLKSLPGSLENLIKQIKLGDEEGIALGLISLIINPLDFLESLGTSLGALASFGVIPTIAFFSLIALPLAITLVGYGAIKGVYDLIRSSIELAKMPSSITNMEELQQVQEYLKEKIGDIDAQVNNDRITENEMQAIAESAEKNNIQSEELDGFINNKVTILLDKKRNILTRHTDIKVANIMKNLQKHLKEISQSKDPNFDTANGAISDMKTLMRRKITSGVAGTAASIAFFVTLVSAAVFPISILAIPIVGGIKFGIEIARHTYNQFFFEKGLREPNFIKLA